MESQLWLEFLRHHVSRDGGTRSLEPGCHALVCQMLWTGAPSRWGRKGPLRAQAFAFPLGWKSGSGAGGWVPWLS
eukprot:3016156-Amphidinium_carterae.1